MVNEKSSSRKIILSMLKNSSAPVSGEVISQHIGVSRVAVWKQIKNLQELGYPIESSPAGYTLENGIDHLYPWEFDGGKENYKAYRELDSTMNKARELALKGCSDFTTVLAEKQNRGRGRGSKTWDSREGGLYFTWILQPDLPLAYHYIYTIGAAAVLSRTIRELTGLETWTKWPNDLLSSKGKIAGFLTEMECSGDRISWLNIGVGINANNEADQRGRSSLKELSGSTIDRKSLLNLFEQNFRQLLRSENPQTIRRLWERESSTIGKNVLLQSRYEGTFSGRAAALSPAGSLIIRNRDKETQAPFGDTYTKNRR